MPSLMMVDPPPAQTSDLYSLRTQQEPTPTTTSTTRVSVYEPVSSDDEVNLNPRHYQPRIHSPSTGGYFTLDDIP